MKNLGWRLGVLSFVLSTAVGVGALEGAVDFVGPHGTFCTSRDHLTGTCAQAWKETLVRGVVLVGGHTSEARVASPGWLAAAFVTALGLMVASVLRRRT